ncbi:MAG: YtxH domain-containing protein [Acidobacteriaceae bacterium]|nr:YtxH domain-containing protein [Acidobacteriaceae bacterium]
MERNDTGTGLLWFAGGVVLGAAVALLIAPESGEDTRRRLRKQAERGRKALSNSSQEIVDRGRELYERGREIAEEAADMFERGRQIAEKRINDAI